MRALATGLSLITLVAVVATTSPAEARREKFKSRDHVHSYDERYDRSHRARRAYRDSEMDIIRAESCDPGGRFSGYPAWARAAFTCGSQR